MASDALLISPRRWWRPLACRSSTARGLGWTRYPSTRYANMRSTGARLSAGREWLRARGDKIENAFWQLDTFPTSLETATRLSEVRTLPVYYFTAVDLGVIPCVEDAHALMPEKKPVLYVVFVGAGAHPPASSRNQTPAFLSGGAPEPPPCISRLFRPLSPPPLPYHHPSTLDAEGSPSRPPPTPSWQSLSCFAPDVLGVEVPSSQVRRRNTASCFLSGLSEDGTNASEAQSTKGPRIVQPTVPQWSSSFLCFSCVYVSSSSVRSPICRSP